MSKRFYITTAIDYVNGQLREQITRFFLRGGDVFSLKRLEALAG